MAGPASRAPCGSPRTDPMVHGDSTMARFACRSITASRTCRVGNGRVATASCHRQAIRFAYCFAGPARALILLLASAGAVFAQKPAPDLYTIELIGTPDL